MIQDFLGLVFPLIFLPVIAFVIYANWRQNRDFNERLKQTAQLHGWDYTPGSWLSYPRITGQNRGKEITVDVVVRGYGKNKQISTRVMTKYNTVIPEDITLEPENISTWITKKFGAQDAQSGDMEFDKKYRVGIKDPNLTMALLTPDTQQKLLQTRMTVWIRNGTITTEEHGLTTDKIEEKIDLLTGLAEKLEKR